jgi:hypothetical protein
VSGQRRFFSPLSQQIVILSNVVHHKKKVLMMTWENVRKSERFFFSFPFAFPTIHQPR